MGSCRSKNKGQDPFRAGMFALPKKEQRRLKAELKKAGMTP